MGRYIVDGKSFPEFSARDLAAYPFLHIAKVEDGSAAEPIYIAYAFSEPGTYIIAENHVRGSLCFLTSYDPATDSWKFADTDVTAYPPIWCNYDMYDDAGSLYMPASEKMLILNEPSLQVGISVGMALKGKGSGEDLDATYVVGTPVTFTLEKDNWGGSMYTLYAYLYAAGESGVQIGLPSGTSNLNAQKVIKAALTINSTYNYAGSTTAQPYCRLYIVAVEPPTEDIEIAVFGLAPVADTVVATASETGDEGDTTTEGTE